MLDRTVRRQQSVLKVKTYLCRKRPIESLQHEISVIGMNSLEHPLQRRLSRSLEFKYLVGFIGPVDFSTRNVQAEATRMAYALPFCKESFAPVQIGIEDGV